MDRVAGGRTGEERHQNVMCDDTRDDEEQMRERTQTEKTE